jgi:hypothetical protein
MGAIMNAIAVAKRFPSIAHFFTTVGTSMQPV